MHRVRDPIHGFIPVRPVEAALIDTTPMQRLRRIKQLGLSHLVYPGAEHSRFPHSLGAMHVAGRLADALRGVGWAGDVGLVRLAALLHDIGHPPLSHAGEQGSRHEVMTLALIRAGDVADVLRRHDVDPEQIAAIVGGTADPVACAIVAGQLDADRMDYLLRDSHMCGVRYGEFDLDRLVESITLTPEGRVGVRRSGQYAAEGLLLARYSMFAQVYFHRTRRILDVLLEAVLPPWPTEPELYLGWDDGRLFELLRHDPRPEAQAIVRRQLPGCIAEVEVRPETHAEADELVAWVTAGLGEAPIVDSSARMLAFRASDDLAIVEPDGRTRSIFAASPVLRRMDPAVEVRRLYVPRVRVDEARARVSAFHQRGMQLRLF